MKNYEKPAVTEIGSLQELTLGKVNKVGPNPDALTQINSNVIGSFTPIGV